MYVSIEREPICLIDSEQYVKPLRVFKGRFIDWLCFMVFICVRVVVKVNIHKRLMENKG